MRNAIISIGEVSYGNMLDIDEQTTIPVFIQILVHFSDTGKP